MALLGRQDDTLHATQPDGHESDEADERGVGARIVHYVTQEEYSKVLPGLVAEIPFTLDRSLRDSLKNRLKYGYQFSLRKRLELDLKDYPSLASEYRIDERDTAEIADHRKSLTHFDGDDGEAPEVDHWRLFMVLRLLVE